MLLTECGLDFSAWALVTVLMFVGCNATSLGNWFRWQCSACADCRWGAEATICPEKQI